MQYHSIFKWIRHFTLDTTLVPCHVIMLLQLIRRSKWSLWVPYLQMSSDELNQDNSPSNGHQMIFAMSCKNLRVIFLGYATSSSMAAVVTILEIYDGFPNKIISAHQIPVINLTRQTRLHRESSLQLKTSGKSTWLRWIYSTPIIVDKVLNYLEWAYARFKQ